MKITTLAQGSTTAALLQIQWILAEANKPFPGLELNKKCAIDMAGEVFSHGEKYKKMVVKYYKKNWRKRIGEPCSTC